MNANNTATLTSLDFSRLTHANPIQCSIASCAEYQESTRHVVSVCGIDIYGILSHIVGTMSLQKLNILNASSESFSHHNTIAFRNTFIVDSRSVYNDGWQENIHTFILKQGVLIYAQKRSKALENILERISADYAKNAHAIAHPPIIDIHITPLTTIDEPHTFEIKIEGRDSPYLLYMLTSAFEQQKLNIHSFSIKTHKSHIEDTFVVQVIDKNSTIDKRELRMKLMLTMQFTYYIRFAANPYKAMIRFQEILADSVSKNKSDDLRTLMLHHNQMASFFAQILGSGDYLWEDFIRANSEETMKTLADTSHKKRKKDIGMRPSQYETVLQSKLDNSSSFEEKIQILNTFKDTQSYFIDLDVLLHYKKNFRELSYRLSELARVVIRHAAYSIYDRLVTLHGTPTTVAGVSAQWLLCGLGKFGGSALGYASDIEIMLIYNDAGNTDGKDVISNKRFFERMLQLLCKNIYSKRNGIFHIDTRLRPYGEAGPLATRLDNFIEYYSENGKSHSVERLALCRMRPVAGSAAMAQRVRVLRDTLLYKPQSIQRQEIFTLRKSQLQSKVTQNTRNAKFSLGALVDVEYNIQMLQVEYGVSHAKLRQPSVHNALICLKEIGEISEKECTAMIHSYDFFRTLINALRLRRGNALDLTLPPEESWELEHLARRMDYTNAEISAGRQLLADFDMHSAQTYRFVKQHLGAAALPAPHASCASLAFAHSVEEVHIPLKIFKNAHSAFHAITVCAHGGCTTTDKDLHLVTEKIKQMFSRILLLSWHMLSDSGEPDRILRDFSRIVENIEQKVENIKQKVENIAQKQDKSRSTKNSAKHSVRAFYAMLLRQPTHLDMLLRILTGSRYISEELIKNPQSISTLLKKDVLQKQKKYSLYSSEIFSLLRKRSTNTACDILHALRVYKKKETLRIICRDICLHAPFENVVAEISDLARVIVRAALIAALYENKKLLPAHFHSIFCTEKHFETKSIVEIETHIPMSILAFGKCGARELNYSSDLDLLCVYQKNTMIPEATYIKIMQQTMWYLTHHTKDGRLYRIDMRLRPYGEASAIANSTASVEHYYKTDARIWELNAAQKLRSIAGNEKLGTQCVQRIHNTIMHRIKKEETIKTIASNMHALRTRAVQKHTRNTDERFEVKNSWGGIRDIECTAQVLQCMALMSKTSKVEKICSDTISSILLLQKNNFIRFDDAQQIIKDYCFLRRVEHFLQVYDDKQLHTISHNDKTCISRITWLTMNEKDEDSFMRQLARIKSRSHAWYMAHVGKYTSA